MANVNMMNNVNNAKQIQNRSEIQRTRADAQKEAVKTQEKAQDAQKAKEKEAVQNEPEKKPGDLVYMSDDGDTVRVSSESKGNLDDGVFMKTGNAEEEEKETIELQNEKAEESAEKREELREEQREEAEKAAEKAEAQSVNSFAGISESRLQQMVRDGVITQNAYEKEIEAREQTREEGMKEAEENSKELSRMDATERKAENTEKALENAFSEASPYSTDMAKEVVDAMNRMSSDVEAQNAAEKLSVNTANS